MESGVVYHYRAATADSSGNLAQSEDQTFTTLNLEDLPSEEQTEELEAQQEIVAVEIQTKIEELLNQGMDEEEIRTIIARATEPPTIAAEGPIIENLTNNSAKIIWVTDRKSNSVIRFKAKEENVDPESSSSLKQYGNFKELAVEHQVILSNLQSGTTYQYQVQSSDVLGNTGKSEWHEFTTGIIPSIYDVLISEITLNSAVISWKTNVVTSSKVEYGETISYTNHIEDKDNSKVAKHLIKLNNLKSGTLYHFRVRGIDIESNSIVSDDYSFTTFTLPQIQTYQIEEISEKIIKINWKTNEPSTSQILWEEGISHDKEPKNSTKEDKNYTTNHIIVITSFKPSSVYRFRITGKDKAANIAQSQDFTILIPEKKKSVIQIIISNFEDTFGWVKKIGG